MTRPVMRYLGGKFRIAEWVISHFPPHHCYVEPFGGGASVLMRKPRVHAEVLNDLNEEIVNVFRVLRDSADELRRRMELTPYSRLEFERPYQPTDDPIERAIRTLIRSFMGQGGDAVTRGYRTGFRCHHRNSTGGAMPAHEWASWPREIPDFVFRLQGVTLECLDASKLIRRLDLPSTLIYCDPPYPKSTRTSTQHGKHGYTHEITDDDHRALAEVLRACRGMVVLSGYPCELYDRELYADWERHTTESRADRGGKRTEVLWLNAAAAAGQRQLRLLA